MNHLMKSLLLVVVCLAMVFFAMEAAVAGTNAASVESTAYDSVGPSVSPNMGGQATIVDITSKYSRFGKEKGKILIGDHPCRVLSWSRKYIRVKIVKDMEVGVYDVTILPAKGNPVLIPYGFEVVRPQIVSSGTIEVMPNTVFTIPTVNLTRKEGKAFMVSEGGQSFSCLVRRWTPVSVKIKIPDVPMGNYSLRLKTEEGTLKVADYFHVRGDTQTWDYSLTDGFFLASATGIMYGGKVCRFAPARRTGYATNGIWYDISDDPRNNGNRGRIVIGDKVWPMTNTNVMPVVIGERLYLFWTMEAGKEFEYTWTDNVVVEKPVWAPLKRITAPGSESESRPSVVYNPVDKTTYIYYAAKSSEGDEDYYQIMVLFSTDLESWNKQALQFAENHERVKLKDSPSATINSKGEIMIARVVGDDVYVTKSTDPFSTSLYSTKKIEEPDVSGSPWIQAMGQGQVALTFYDGHNHTRVFMYTDDWDSWDSGETYEGSNSFRSTTLMPVFSKYIDDPNRGGEGIELRLWFFFWNNDTCYGREERYLGELRKVDEQKTNWSTLAKKMGYTGSDAADVQEEINRACPLVGVVDLPLPCALNGKTADDNKTWFSFYYVQASAKTVQETWKVGVFVTTGSAAYFVGDIHAGVQGAFSKTTTTATKIEYVYDATSSTGKIPALHAVPTTIARKFRAYRDGRLIESVPPIVVLQVVGMNLMPVEADPPKGIPTHTLGDLSSYNNNYAAYEFVTASGGWGQGTPTIQLTEGSSESTTTGFYLSIKAGGQIPTAVSFGLEGSLTWDVTHQTTTSNSWALHLENPKAQVSGDVESFAGTLLLIKPTKNSKSFWVPSYVTQGRDAAWFVTYYINNIKLKK